MAVPGFTYMCDKYIVWPGTCAQYNSDLASCVFHLDY